MPLCPHREESEGIFAQVVYAGLTFAVPPNPHFELPLPFRTSLLPLQSNYLVATPPRNDTNLPGALVRRR
jgi:hypothetical protein